jgi:hypothetical protein
MVGVVAGVDTPSVERSMGFAARIGLAHSVVGSGELFTGASVIMPEGRRTDGD